MKKERVVKWMKIAIIIVCALLGFFLLLFLGAGWYFSDILYDKAFNPMRSPREKDTRVLQVDEKRIVLERTTPFDVDYRHRGIFGIEWDGGFGHVTDVISSDEKQATRVFSLITGTLPEVGTETLVDGYVYPRATFLIEELPSRQVFYTSDLGKFSAYVVDNRMKTWIILVHGNGMVLSDTRRMALSFYKLGYPTLTISYRNDEDQPADPSGILLYGVTEWIDLEGAVQYALDNGSRDVVLFGMSMGGGVVLSFMYKSKLKNHVKGLILDSPILDFGKAVDINATKERLPLIGFPIPQLLTDLAKLIAQLRFTIRWQEIDYLKDTDKLEVPILLFHGSSDLMIPVTTSDELAENRKDLIFHYMRTEGVYHCRTWNYDRDTYERHLAEFMDAVME